MKEYRTPQKVYARSAEKGNSKLKDFPIPNQITMKRLNAAFTSVSEDSTDFSPMSEISHANRNEGITTLMLEEASPETLPPSDIMPSKKITDGAGVVSTGSFSVYELDSAMFTYVKAEIAANSLRNAQPEVLHSLNGNAAPRYRKLMDELTEYVMEDLHRSTLPEDSNRFAQVLPAKNRILFLCFCIWIIGVLAVLFFTSDIHCPTCGPFPL